MMRPRTTQQAGLYGPFSDTVSVLSLRLGTCVRPEPFTVEVDSVALVPLGLHHMSVLLRKETASRTIFV